MSGLLIGLFGLGAFWVPAICLLTSIHFLGNHTTKAISLTLGGGVLLAVTTGALMALRQHHYLIFGAKFSAGGIIGIPLKNFLVTSANATGASTILIVFWIVGFILATGFSIRAFFGRCVNLGGLVWERFKTAVIKVRERRRRKTQTRIKTQHDAGKEPRNIQIKAPEIRPAPKVPIAKQEVFDFMKTDTGFRPPSIKFLDDSEDQIIPGG